MQKIISLIFSVCLIVLSSHAQSHSSMNESRKITLDLVLKVQSGEDHPPYVAAWLEDEASKSVRTLILWRKEPKWLKDIRRWWRKEGKFDAELVDAVTSATHAAGRFPLSFSAVDNQQKPLKAGKYTLFVEVVREKGGRAIIRQPFELNENSLEYTLAATQETDTMRFSISQ